MQIQMTANTPKEGLALMYRGCLTTLNTIRTSSSSGDLTEYSETTCTSFGVISSRDIAEQRYARKFYYEPFAESFVSLSRRNRHQQSESYASKKPLFTETNNYPHPPGSQKFRRSEYWNVGGYEDSNNDRLNATNIFISANNRSPVHIHTFGGRIGQAALEGQFAEEENEEKANFLDYDYVDSPQPGNSIYSNHCDDLSRYPARKKELTSCLKDNSQASSPGACKRVTFDRVNPEPNGHVEELNPSSTSLNRAFTSYRNAFDPSFQSQEV